MESSIRKSLNQDIPASAMFAVLRNMATSVARFKAVQVIFAFTSQGNRLASIMFVRIFPARKTHNAKMETFLTHI